MRGKLTIGMDLGDRSSRYCILDEQGEAMLDRSIATTRKGMDSSVRINSAMPHRFGGRDTLTLGEPASGETGTRGDRGECATRPVDQRE
jgi:hypothetical protein